MLDYQRIEQAIRFIRENFQEQPDLDEIARQIHLSPFHFQRLFKEWAGVSPKKISPVYQHRIRQAVITSAENPRNGQFRDRALRYQPAPRLVYTDRRNDTRRIPAGREEPAYIL